MSFLWVLGCISHTTTMHPPVVFVSVSVDLAMNYSEIEVKVRQATDGNEPWGPHGSIMNELAQVCVCVCL